MCQDLPYNTTFMPNLLNHYDQQTAALAMEVSFVRRTFCLPKDLEKYVFFYFYVHYFVNVNSNGQCVWENGMLQGIMAEECLSSLKNSVNVGK